MYICIYIWINIHGLIVMGIVLLTCLTVGSCEADSTFAGITVYSVNTGSAVLTRATFAFVNI